VNTVDWFNELGLYLRLLPGAHPMAMDMATTPGLDAERSGYNIGYRMQSAPESLSVYPSEGQ